MQTFWLRIDWRADKGCIFADEVVINEAASMDGFSAWQEACWYNYSIVADPMFVDAEHDNFHLKPLSIDEMGLIIDVWRKSK